MPGYVEQLEPKSIQPADLAQPEPPIDLLILGFPQLLFANIYL